MYVVMNIKTKNISNQFPKTHTEKTHHDQEELFLRVQVWLSAGKAVNIPYSRGYKTFGRII